MENLWRTCGEPVENTYKSVENPPKNAYNSVENIPEFSTPLGLAWVDLLYLGGHLSPHAHFSPNARDLSTTYPQLIHRRSAPPPP